MTVRRGFQSRVKQWCQYLRESGANTVRPGSVVPRAAGVYGYMHMDSWDLLWSVTAKAALAADLLRPHQMVAIVPGLLAVRHTRMLQCCMYHNCYNLKHVAPGRRRLGNTGWRPLHMSGLLAVRHVARAKPNTCCTLVHWLAT